MSEAIQRIFSSAYRHDCILSYDKYSKNTESNGLSMETIKKYTGL